jgi:hypothetical protein
LVKPLGQPERTIINEQAPAKLAIAIIKEQWRKLGLLFESRSWRIFVP